MSQISILIVEDEPEVRDAVERDLAPFASTFRIETAEDVEDARQVMADCDDDGDVVGLILCDHVLPGTNGVDFLIEINEQEATEPVRKVLITGQAGLEDTIRAVNDAGLDHYIAKPWSAEDLHQVVRDELTEYVINRELDVMPYVEILDGKRLLETYRTRAADK